MINRKSLLFVLFSIIILTTTTIYFLQQPRKNKIAKFIGKERCQNCHKSEYKLWKQSHHSKAMAVASDSTVLGNFNNQIFISSDGKKTLFFKKGKKFYVKTEGEGGIVNEYEITHTFGYTPLQQYLIPFNNGRYQCLPIAWDTEGKKWFSLPEYLYANEKLTPTNWLYWTNGGQNWNGMCAECHSTNVKKNFNPITKSYNTTYSEINVSCESCHGPGSLHEEWANSSPIKTDTVNNKGLIVKTKNITNREYIEICARCHSRRSQFEDFKHGRKNLLDFMLPSLLDENYYPDGQILEEDYVYGSFVQSKMFANKVKCNDCHNVHSGKLKQNGNKLCAQCHKPEIYDTKKHHFHKYKDEKGKPIVLTNKTINVGEGALCINCHMPGKYYMGVDYRRDHSMRIPRPDLSISIKVPNACNQCHKNKSPQWANNYVNKWYNTRNKKTHFGTTFAAARKSEPQAEQQLINIARSKSYPLIVKATAISLMDRYFSDSVRSTIKWALKEPEALMRVTALRAYSSTNINEFKNDLLKLLNDSVKAVRAQAAFTISGVLGNEIPDNYINAFNSALEEYKAMNLYMADFPSGRMNLGILYANLDDFSTSAKHFEEAIKIDSLFFPAKLNLALIYNQLNKKNKAEVLLRDIINNHPEIPEAYYYLGLLIAEKQNYTEAINLLRKASKLMPKKARINYNIGLMLEKSGSLKEAEKELIIAVKKEPSNFNFLYALANFYIKNHNYTEAKKYAKKIKKLFPSSKIGNDLLNYIKNSK